jgi:hypothetical protein
MIARLFALLMMLLTSPAVSAQDAADRAFADATDAFETALPRIGSDLFGVNVSDYRDALTLRRFSSSHWGGTVKLAVTSPSSANGACGRFAAYVTIPPQNGVATLALCPQFYRDGSDSLRRLTVLHEMVHVVAGPDECRAMAFAARIEVLATGRHTPVDRYWNANGCAGSAYSLP